jgi:transcriptional regulator with XRE-family HTH domain
LQRRHIEVAGIVNIGKEANEVEEQFYLGADPDSQPIYGMAEHAHIVMHNRIAAAVRRFGQRQLAQGTGIAPRTLASILRCGTKPTTRTIGRLLRWISVTEANEDEQRRGITELLDWARTQTHLMGLRRFAAEKDIDAANLAKVLSGQRMPSERLLARLRSFPAGGCEPDLH